MEGMLASAVLKLAGAKLASAIEDQVMMQWNLNNNLEDMKGTLEYMEAVLNDAERRSIKEKSVLLWLKQLKNAAYDISDMLDDFQDGKRTGLLSHVRNAAKNIGLPKRMKKLKQQLRKIQEDHVRFQLTRDSGGTTEQQIIDQRETFSAVNEEDVVGREEEKKKIVELLLERNSKEESIIVPIHGLGGIGKTTLARLVFNNTHFKEYDHRVWVYVSQVLDLKKIGNFIISDVSKQGSHDLNVLESINERLKVLLNGKKCLIVLDDLWEERETELEKLKTMLNVGKAGSKIDVVVTTRNEEIAQKIWTGKSYPLKPLDDTMCWSIIKKRCNFESRRDKEQLEQIGQDIANKCAGIALAAQALGYELSRKNLGEWSAIRDSDIWSLSKPEDTSFPLPSLMLSYKSMPSYLKLCFAYCAIFPKGHNIGKYDLIHQWIALDFIEPSETFSATQLGEKYVRQLQGMSFLHHSDLSPSFHSCDSMDSDLPEDNSVSLQLFMVSDVNTCSKLHQLEDVNLKELKISCLENVRSLEEARKIKLLEIESLSKLTLGWTSDEDRFLDDKDVLGELVPPRGLQHFELDGYSCISFPIWLMGISHYQYPNLIEIKLENLPRCSDLSPLGQYLPNLIEIKLENLPKCNDLSPLGQLPNLDKLHLGRLQSVTKIDRDFSAGEGAFLRLSEFRLYYMEQLKEWNTAYCREDGVEEFMFPKLDRLDIVGCPKLRLTPRPPIFRIWKICNSDMVISSWSEGDHISHSPSDTPGTTVEVRSSKVSVGEWRLLHHLPTLQVLVIEYCDKLTSLPENTQHLASLRSLKLYYCNGISALPEWLGHLTSLERLIIDGCSRIKSLPHCIQQLTKLKELQILSNHKLKKWCESDENKMKLAHIENISYGRY